MVTDTNVFIYINITITIAQPNATYRFYGSVWARPNDRFRQPIICMLHLRSLAELYASSSTYRNPSVSVIGKINSTQTQPQAGKTMAMDER
jgi:hypothetical protein